MSLEQQAGPIIEAKALSKEYVVREKDGGLLGHLRALLRPRKKTITAVEKLDLTVQRGELVAYLGPNGAGKSTTIKMLVGILQPSAGEIRIDGLSPSCDRKAIARRIGVVFGQRTQLHWDIRLGESFELLKRIYRIEADRYAGNLEYFKTQLDIGSYLDQPVRSLSLGQRMRAEIAAALLHDPDILFLDEPTIGLDIDAKLAVRNFIRQLNEERRTTVLLTSHDLEDVQKICRRLIVINHGRLVEDGPLESLINRLCPHRTLIVDCAELPETLALNVPGLTLKKREGDRLWLQYTRGEHTAPEMIRAISEHLPIRELSLEEPSIEEMIREVYKQPQ